MIKFCSKQKVFFPFINCGGDRQGKGVQRSSRLACVKSQGQALATPGQESQLEGNVKALRARGDLAELFLPRLRSSQGQPRRQGKSIHDGRDGLKWWAAVLQGGHEQLSQGWGGGRGRAA